MPIILNKDSFSIENSSSYLGLNYNNYLFTKDKFISLFKKYNNLDFLFDKIVDFFVKTKYKFIIIDNYYYNNFIHFNINYLIIRKLNIPIIIILDCFNKSIDNIINMLLLDFYMYNNLGICICYAFIINSDISTDEFISYTKEKNIMFDFLVFFISDVYNIDSIRVNHILKLLSNYTFKYINTSSSTINIKNIFFRSVSYNYLSNHINHNIIFILPFEELSYLYDIIKFKLKFKIIIIFIYEDEYINVDINKYHLNDNTSVLFVKSCYVNIYSTLLNHNIIKQDYNTISLKNNSSLKYLNCYTKIIKNNPIVFKKYILEKSRNMYKHIILPEGEDSRVLQAGYKFVMNNLGVVTFLGNPSIILKLSKELSMDWSHDKMKIINPVNYKMYKDFYNTFYNNRKHKGISIDQSKKIMLDPSYIGTMMVYLDLADGMVSGAIHTTADTIRPALQLIKTKPGLKSASSFFFMLLDRGVVIYADCALLTNPSYQDLADIAVLTANTATRFSITPIVAMLSYSSGFSGYGKDVDKVRQATLLVKKQYPNLNIEGPIQYDAAVDIMIEKQKIPNSLLGGKANVFIFPDLNSGNITYKAVQRETKCDVIGPIIQGLNKPVNDLSRGSSIEDIYNTMIITSIQ
jgi:phosphate acetyltransferase